MTHSFFALKKNGKTFLLTTLLTIFFAMPSTALRAESNHPPFNSTPLLTITQQPATISNMGLNTIRTLTFILTNNAPIALDLTAPVMQVQPNPLLVTMSASNNCNSVIQPGQTCTFTLQLTSSAQSGAASATFSFGASNSRNAPAISPTYSFLIDTQSATNFRTITFDNQCTFPIWMGITGGSVNSKLSPADCTTNSSCVTTCNSDADCYAGTQCVQTGSIKQCFSINPIPDGDDYQVAANTQKTVRIPVPDADINFQGIIWSGSFAGRTGCTGTTCDTGMCAAGGAPGDKACTPGTGFTPPMSIAEITMLREANPTTDAYDISIINGVNLPIAFGPTTAAHSSSNPYICGTPGSVTNTVSSGGTIGACGWSFKSAGGFPPPTIDYRFVSAGGANCSVDSDCSASPVGPTCGLSLTNVTAVSVSGTSAQKTCGRFLGWWSNDQICGLNSLVGAPFNCPTSAGLSGSFVNYTLTNLFLCSGLNAQPNIDSCYQSSATANNCCGCVNWDTLGILLPTNPSIVPRCVATTASWNTNIQPDLEWMKQACPSVYVYPFDDKTSSYTCPDVVPGGAAVLNTTNYTVTLCPGGNTGTPS